MKKYVLLLAVLVLLTGCTFNYDSTKGKVNKAETTIYKTNNHKEEEINTAIEDFKREFRDTFYKCDLLAVEYGKDDYSDVEKVLMSREENPTDALALVFRFKTSADAYKELESSKEYTFFGYMIKVDGNWKLISSGEILV